MTISELRLALDISFENKADVLKRHAKQMSNGSYLFVDSSDGSCYLFDRDGNEDGIAKLYRIEVALFYRDSGLKLVRIPESVTSIGDSAFYYCTNLTSVTIPDSVTSIENYAFYNCSSIMNAIIPNSITCIGSYAFSGCTNLKELIFKGKSIDEVKAIKDYPWGIKDESIMNSMLS